MISKHNPITAIAEHDCCRTGADKIEGEIDRQTYAVVRMIHYRRSKL